MAAVAKCDTEIAELDQAIKETTANLNSLRASLESAADGMINKVVSLASQRASQDGAIMCVGQPSKPSKALEAPPLPSEDPTRLSG